VKPKKSYWALLLGLSLSIGIAAAASLTIWGLLRAREGIHARDMAGSWIRSIRADITDEVSSQVQEHVQLAKLIEDGVPRKSWENQARLLIVQHPGFLIEEWVDATYQVRWYTDAAGETHQGLFPVTDAPLMRSLEGLVSGLERGPVLTPTFTLWDGKIGRRLVVPIYKRKKVLGFLIAIIDEQEYLRGVLADQSELFFSMAIFDGKTEIYGVPHDNSEYVEKWGRESEIRLPGATWRVLVWPKPELFRENVSTLLEVAFAIGSVIALVALMIIQFGQAAYTKSQELFQSLDESEMRVREHAAKLELSGKKLEVEIHDRKDLEESFREISGRLLTLRDDEQRRLARELHDNSTQLLGAFAINIERIQQLVLKGEISKSQKLLAESAELLQAVTAQVRTTSYLLHPPLLDDLGLGDTLITYAAGFSGRSGIHVSVNVQPELGRFPSEVELTLFRIVQEALTNIHRHSGSATAEVTLFEDAGRVTLLVTDNGRGIPPEVLQPKGDARALVGVGIAGMRERIRQLAGCLEIESGDRGTCLKATLPIGTANPV
jgi:signal transduction histidine kinase